MKKIFSTALIGLFAMNLAYAQAPAAPAAPAAAPAAVAVAAGDCEAKAVSKAGKPLAGAAKTAFMKKCQGDSAAPSACESKAVGKNGKPLAGAAKTAFMKKCEADAK